MTKSGFVALLGHPNVGKSSVLNAIIGEKLSIVTPKPQTTRQRITGILTRTEGQIIFIDTPGLFEPKNKLDQFMAREIKEAFSLVDLGILIVNPEDNISDMCQIFADFSKPLLVAVNKIDIAKENYILPKKEYFEGILGRKVNDILKISAKTKENLENLIKEILAFLPESPYLYPPDQISTELEKDIISELIRENIMLLFKEEIPYSAAVIIEEFKERQGGKIFISAEIIVDKESIKPMIIGKNGVKIAEIGKLARKEIENFLQSPVYLELRVKCREKWRDKPVFLKSFGYTIKK